MTILSLGAMTYLSLEVLSPPSESNRPIDMSFLLRSLCKSRLLDVASSGVWLSPKFNYCTIIGGYAAIMLLSPPKEALSESTDAEPSELFFMLWSFIIGEFCWGLGPNEVDASGLSFTEWLYRRICGTYPFLLKRSVWGCFITIWDWEFSPMLTLLLLVPNVGVMLLSIIWEPLAKLCDLRLKISF